MSTTSSSRLERVFPGDSELASRLLALDWSTTSLGPPEAWPQNLRTCVGICLTSPVPIVLWWGADFTILYNDAYRPFLGEAGHPRFLGRPGREAWSDSWNVIGPILEGVRATGRATWSEDTLLFFARNRPREEVYVRFMYGPILNDDVRTVDGIFTPCIETTQQVVGARWLETLRRLGASSTGTALTVETACRAAAATLADNPYDVPFAGIYVVDEAGHAAIKATVGPPDVVDALPRSTGQATTPAWPLAAVLSSRRPAEYDMRQLERPQAGTLWVDPIETALVLPVPAAAPDAVAGLVVIGASPRRVLDSSYRSFLALIADRIATSLADVRASEAEKRRAETLAELDRARTVVDTMPDRFFAFDRNWRAIEFNAHAEAQLRSLGKDPAAFIGKVVWEEFPNTPAEAVFRRVMRERLPITHEHYYAGLGEWIENRICPSANGGVAVFQRYVTDRKRAEEELRRSEANLADAQRLSHTGSWSWNVASDQLLWSAEHFRIIGVDPETVRPSYPGALQWIHPDDRPRVQEAFDRLVRDKSDFEVECRIVRPDGTVRHIRSLARPVFNDRGDLVEYVGTIIDTTERKRAEERLRESEQRFRLLAETIPHHVWTYLPDGSMGYWNQRLIDYTALTSEELRRGGWAAVHPADVPRVEAAWRQAWSERTPYEVEQRLRGRDGHYRRFLSRAVPVLDDQGELVQWFGTNTDVEDRHQAEEALQKAHSELAHVTRVTAMGELAGSLAHALNQPLAAIVTNGGSCLRFLDRDAPDLEKALEAVRCIMQDAERAGEVIAGTRAFLKKSTGERTLLDINALIHEVLVVLQTEIRRHAVAVRDVLATDLPAVLGRRIEIQQVVLNLVMNGIEAMAAATDRRRDLVVSSACQKFDGELIVLVAVTDSGVGLGDGDPDRLFDAFYTTKPDGLGMGLSISRSVIEAHGGRLWATPDVGGGATFQFTLPAHSGPSP
jgi:PAS domain S-box-containing protein